RGGTSELMTSCERRVQGRSAPGDLAGRLVEYRGLVGGPQLTAGTRCVRVGARDAEVEFTQFVDYRLDELRAPVAKQFGAHTKTALAGAMGQAPVAERDHDRKHLDARLRKRVRRPLPAAGG